MNYNIKGTEVTITPEIRAYLEKKLASLDKFLPDTGAARADVELQYLVGEAKMYRVEVMLFEPSLKSSLRAEATGGTLYEAIDLVEAELFTELTRTKKKRLDNLRHGAARAKEFLRGWRDRI